MADILAFWAAALVIGACGWPIAAVLLRRLPDAGAGLAIPLGLLLASYGYFILRIIGVLSVGRGGFLLAVLLLALVSAAVASRDRWLRVTLWRAWPGMVVAAGIFTMAFFGSVSLRSYTSEISGTEQPMDFLYLNAMLESPEYPPQDPWLAGERASYYYFGYLQSAMLTSVADVPSSTGYNLSLGYTFAAAASGIASLAFALARWLFGSRARGWAMSAGGIAIGLLLFTGSLSAVFVWTASHEKYNEGVYEAFGVPWLLPCDEVTATDCYRGPSPRTESWYPTEFWFAWGWNGSRIIPDTITEFPAFSFALGDLHPHVMSIPLVLLVLGLSAATWRGRTELTWRNHRAHPWPGVATAIILGALAFQNAWDVLTFTLVFVLAVFARNLRRAPPLDALLKTGAYVGPIALLALVAYSPWLRDFSSQAEGMKPYIGAGTRPAHLFLQFGMLLSAALLCALGIWRRSTPAQLLNTALATAWLPLLPFLLWIGAAQLRGDLSAGVDARGSGGWVSMVIYAACVWLLAASAIAFTVQKRSAAVPATLATIGALLLYGSELFYIADVFEGGVPRLNTIFKLSYQAWILLSVAGAVALAGALRSARIKPLYAVAALPVAALCIGGFAYPLLTTFNRTDAFNAPTHIDGLAAIGLANPNEYDITRWIQLNVPRDAVILEATGRQWAGSSENRTMTNANVDYSDSGRISARTGRATPIGWYFHEVQWRGDTEPNRAEFSLRQDIVDFAYVSGDPETVLTALREFGAEYLVVGAVELGKYPGFITDMSAFLDVAYRSGQYTIYRLPTYEAVQTS